VDELVSELESAIDSIDSAGMSSKNGRFAGRYHPFKDRNTGQGNRLIQIQMVTQ
jgi:hypothetical protein